MIKKDIKQKMQNPIPNVSFTFSESILKLFNDSDTFNLTIANGHLKGLMAVQKEHQLQLVMII